MNIVLSLLEATLALYPADAAGAPITSAPVWLGACAENLEVRDNWLTRDSRPTGRRYPRQQPLVPQYEIAIQRVWVVPTANRIGFTPTRGQYVLDLLWQDEDGNGWRREVYYGVTITERSRTSKDLDARDGAAFVERQAFRAESKVESSGTGTPPALAAGLAYRVQYQSALETVDLYSYDAGTELFTELASPVGRATLTYTPPDRSDIFEVRFGGPAVVSVDALGVLQAAVFVAGVPTGADLPRLNFFVGAQRVASISAAGVVFATTFQELTPAASAGISFFGGGARQVLLTLPVLQATSFQETLSIATADSSLVTADTTLETADLA